MKNKFIYSTSIAILLASFIGNPVVFAVDVVNENVAIEENEVSDNQDSEQETSSSDSEFYNPGKEETEKTTPVATEDTEQVILSDPETGVVESTIESSSVATASIQGNWGTASVNYDPDTFTLTVGPGVITEADRMSFSEVVNTSEIQHLIFEQGSALKGDLTGWSERNNIKKLVTINGPVDTSGVTNTESMFYYSENLVSIDVSSWDTSNITNMRSMFAGAYALKSFDANNWDTSNVTDMTDMFRGTISLESINIQNWNTSSVTKMRMMFKNAKNLKSLELNSWDVSQVTDFNGMFSEINVSNLDLSNWNTTSATDMSSMFYYAQGIQTLNASGWDTSNVTDITYMFEGARSLTDIDVSNWDTSKIDDMTTVFQRTNLKSLDLSNWNTKNVSRFAAMFRWTYLEELTLGENFTAFPDAVLRDVDNTRPEGFTGAWIRTDGEKKYASSTAFMNEYDGSYPGTYIWAIPATINAKDSTLYVGDDWNPEDNFISATDGAKNARSFDEVNVTEIDPVDTTKPGNYRVSYQYDDQSITVMVTVLENLTTLNTKDLTIYQGDMWKAEDHFVGATTKDGSPASFTDLLLSDDHLVDASKVGTYVFKLINGKVINNVTLKVLKDQAIIQAKDKTIYVGDSWEAKDTFVSATDRDGNPLKLEDLKVSNTVNTGKVGKYEVTYTWDVVNADGRKTGKTISATSNVTVLDKKTPTKPSTDNPVKGNQGTTIGQVNTTVANKVSSEKNLPKTGEEISNLGIWAGIVIFILAIWGFVSKKKVNKN